MARPRSFDETEVLDAARDQFRRGGYAGTSVADLTAATGLGKGSLYGAFGDKHQLYLNAFDGYCQHSVAGLRAALDAPPWRLRQQLAATLAAGAVPDGAGRSCMLTQATAELAAADPAVAERAGRAYTAIRDAFAEVIVRLQAVGQLDPDADPDELAELLLVVQRGLEVLGSAGRDPEVLGRAAARAVDALPPGPR